MKKIDYTLCSSKEKKIQELEEKPDMIIIHETKGFLLFKISFINISNSFL